MSGIIKKAGERIERIVPTIELSMLDDVSRRLRELRDLLKAPLGIGSIGFAYQNISQHKKGKVWVFEEGKAVLRDVYAEEDISIFDSVRIVSLVDLPRVQLQKIGITINAATVTLGVDIKAQTVGNLGVDIKAATVKVGITINATDVTGNLPIDINAQTVGNIAVNLAANTLGNLTVDIAAQTLSELNINIAASAITVPIDISAQSFGNLAIDIAAQTVGNLGIDIKAATAKVGITINVADITGNLPIDITAQTIGNIGIDIKAATAKVGITINVADITGNIPIDIKAQTLGTIAISINVANITGNLPIDIKAQTIGNIGIDIKAATAKVGITINVADITGNLPIDIKAQTLGTIAISINVANITGNLPIDIKAQTVGNLGIDIKAQTLTNLKVDINAQTLSTIAISLNAANITGNIPIDIKAQTLGTVNIAINTANITGNIPIDIKAQTVGNIGIDIKAQTIGNVSVDIKAQTVDLNIKTSGGVNLVIDKLTQTAYIARAGEVSNDNGVTTPTAPPSSITGTAYHSKFFPRGMRGHILRLSIYCKRTSTGTITLAYSPQPGMGKTGSVVITPAADWNWKYAFVNVMWNYDALFIWVESCSADVSFGRELTTPQDNFKSTDSGVTWIAYDERTFIRAYFYGETVGDLPVSGTINIIQIPSQSVERLYTVYNALPDTDTVIKTIDGAGNAEYLLFYIDAVSKGESTAFKVLCDGVIAFFWSFKSLNDRGYSTATPGITLIKYLADGICAAHVTLRFAFKRQLQIQARADGHILGGGIPDFYCEGMVNLIR